MPGTGWQFNLIQLHEFTTGKPVRFLCGMENQSDPDADRVTLVVDDLRKKMIIRPSLAAIMVQLEKELREIAIEDGLIPTPSGQ